MCSTHTSHWWDCLQMTYGNNSRRPGSTRYIDDYMDKLATKLDTLLRKKKSKRPPKVDSKAPLVELHKPSTILQRSMMTQHVDTSTKPVNELMTNIESLTTDLKESPTAQTTKSSKWNVDPSTSTQERSLTFTGDRTQDKEKRVKKKKKRKRSEEERSRKNTSLHMIHQEEEIQDLFTYRDNQIPQQHYF